MKIYTRRQFLHLSSLAGAAVVLARCGTGPSQNKGANDTASKIGKGAVPAGKVNIDLADSKDVRYNALRQGFNKRIDMHPALIAVCTSTEDVAAAVKLANERKMPIAVKSGGHSMEGFSCNDNGMVINLSDMSDVTVLPGDRVKIQPGCKLAQLYNTILPKGLLLPAGSCGTVAVGGLALGGGYGLFARKYGFTCDHLIEATMVDGKGNVHHTKDDPELLWALKGGGTGNFGIVTEMTFETHKAPAKLQAHYFKARKLNATRAASILQTWMTVAAALPESCFSGYVLNGSTLNILITNYDIDNQQLPKLLSQLAEVVDEFRSSRVGELATMLRNYYGRPGPLNFRNSSAGFFKGYNDIAPFITEVFEKITTTPGMIYQVNTLGGKVNDAAFEKLACYPHRGFEFISELQAYWEEPSRAGHLAGVTTEILKLTAQNGITMQYVNYCSLEFSDWEHAYYGDNYSRLQAVKRKYDPNDNIRHPQSVRV